MFSVWEVKSKQIFYVTHMKETDNFTEKFFEKETITRATNKEHSSRILKNKDL